MRWDVNFTEVKAPLKERFAKVPFIKFEKGDDSGLLGFDKALEEEEIAYMKESIRTINSNEVQWSVPVPEVLPTSQSCASHTND